MLTARFAAEDFAVSSSFPAYVRPVPLSYRDRIQNLAQLLEEMQLHLDAAHGAGAYRIVITSAYRTAQLNTAVGGAATSLHLEAEAADFSIVDKAGRSAADLLPELWLWIRQSMLGRVGEVELTLQHIHISNPVRGQLNDFMTKISLPMKVFEQPPTPAEALTVVAAVAAVLALSRL